MKKFPKRDNELGIDPMTFNLLIYPKVTVTTDEFSSAYEAIMPKKLNLWTI